MLNTFDILEAFSKKCAISLSECGHAQALVDNSGISLDRDGALVTEKGSRKIVAFDVADDDRTIFAVFDEDGDYIQTFSLDRRSNHG